MACSIFLLDNIGLRTRVEIGLVTVSQMPMLPSLRIKTDYSSLDGTAAALTPSISTRVRPARRAENALASVAIIAREEAQEDLLLATGGVM